MKISKPLSLLIATCIVSFSNAQILGVIPPQCKVGGSWHGNMCCISTATDPPSVICCNSAGPAPCPDGTLICTMWDQAAGTCGVGGLTGEVLPGPEEAPADEIAPPEDGGDGGTIRGEKDLFGR